MANSSEWLGALDAPPRVQPGWLAMLGDPAEFRATSPFGTGERALPASDPPDPHAAPPDLAADALARAFAEGEAAGRAAMQAEAEAAATRQRALRLALRTLDEAAQSALSHDLAETVIALCDAALAGAVIDKDVLAARCAAAAARIGAAAEALTLHLHPDDVALLGDDALGGWQVTPDPALERGSVQIESTDGAVSDGPAEWRRAIAAAVRG